MNQKPFQQLTPDFMLDALEQAGYPVDGRITELNSYENRVLLIGLEDQPEIVVKFYRPERWSREQILEEHEFTLELESQEVEVISPVKDSGSVTLQHYRGFDFAVYPKRWGHPLELDNLDQLVQVGTVLGRLHATGSISPFKHRRALTPDIFGWQARETCLNSGFIPDELIPAYSTLTQHLLEKTEQIWNATPFDAIRLHGDFHPGNILIRDDQTYLVDFDDCISGPAIQDIWMLLSGDNSLQTQQLMAVLEGYEMFHDFIPAELKLVECCRTLRIVHYAAWLAQRWEDPAFPRAFPWFATPRFWSDHILQLREQQAALEQPPIRLPQFNQ